MGIKWKKDSGPVCYSNDPVPGVNKVFISMVIKSKEWGLEPRQ